MEISLGDCAGVAVLRLRGDLRLWGQQGMIEQVRDRLHSLIAQGHKRLILNLSQVTHIDSRGIGCVARCVATAADQGAQMHLVVVPGLILDTLVKLKFTAILSTHPDEKTAAEALTK